MYYVLMFALWLFAGAIAGVAIGIAVSQQIPIPWAVPCSFVFIGGIMFTAYVVTP